MRRACPVCGGRFLRFRAAQGRRGAACPRCGSLERHRHLWLYLQRRLDVESRPLATVHVAPDPALDRRLRACPGEYVSGDLGAVRGERELDLTDLWLDDATVDLLIAYHVLEHIPDDAAAFREIARVLRPDGVALLQVPTRPGPTVEDPSAPPPERLRRFGQADHVRVYGDDFAARLGASGLRCAPDVFRDELAPRERERFGLVYVDDPDPLRDALWTIWRCAPALTPGS
jgi:SAM-dependent methyltransferase